jgi:hypothetical protein
MISQVAGTTIATFDLTDVVALTLSVDYNLPSSALLIASLGPAAATTTTATNTATGAAGASSASSVVPPSAASHMYTSSAYSDLALQLHLHRRNDEQATASLANVAISATSQRTVYRRGLGDLVIMPLTSEDILYAEPSAPGNNSQDPSSPPPPSGSPSGSASPKSGGAGYTLKNLLTSSSSSSSSSQYGSSAGQGGAGAAEGGPGAVAAAVTKAGGLSFNTVEVAVVDKADSRSIVGSHVLSLGEFSVPAAAGTTAGTTSSTAGTGAAGGVGGSRGRAGGGAGGTSSASAATTAAVARRLKYYDTVSQEVELKIQDNFKAARLVIARADELPSSSASLAAKKVPPTVYATVYLVDANGEKRSVNNADSRTEAVKSFDPEWNKEVLLQNEKQGVDDIAAVMVLLRDSAMGFIKHHHIGQVTIPFSCFLDNTQASFCLPLVPTYRYVFF